MLPKWVTLLKFVNRNALLELCYITRHNFPDTQFWHAQLQPDTVTNQLQDEAEAGNLK